MTQLAVIFDMDGVLVDSYHAHFESWKQLYGELGVAYTEATFAVDFGRTSRDILRRTLGDDLTDEQRERARRPQGGDLSRHPARGFPGDGRRRRVDSTSLAADGFRLAIGSSGPPENVALALERLPGAEHFNATVTGADVTRGKPDPQVFLIAAERLGVPAACMCSGGGRDPWDHGGEARRHGGDCTHGHAPARRAGGRGRGRRQLAAAFCRANSRAHRDARD